MVLYLVFAHKPSRLHAGRRHVWLFSCIVLAVGMWNAFLPGIHPRTALLLQLLHSNIPFPLFLALLWLDSLFDVANQ